MNGTVLGTIAFYVAWLLSTKWILSSGTGYGFMFPICLGCWHIGICLMSTLWVLKSDNALAELQTLWKRQWRGMLAVGALLALDMMFQYTSLVNQSLTLNQIVRSIVPSFMGIGVIVIERRVPPPAEFAALVLLGLGVGLALWDGTVVGSPYASLCCMTGAACHTAVIYFAGKVMGSGMSSARAAFNLFAAALTFLLPLYFMQEAASVHRFWSIAGGDMVLVLLTSSALAAAYAHLHCGMVAAPQDYLTLAEAKLAAVLSCSFFFLGEKSVWTPLLTLGCLFTFAGVYGFKLARQQQQGSPAGDPIAGLASETRYQQEQQSEQRMTGAITSVIRV